MKKLLWWLTPELIVKAIDLTQDIIDWIRERNNSGVSEWEELPDNDERFINEEDIHAKKSRNTRQG